MGGLQRNNVTVSGRGGRTIIFAPGFGTDHTAWRKVAPAFAKEFRVALLGI